MSTGRGSAPIDLIPAAAEQPPTSVGSGARQCLRPPLVVPPGHSVQGLEEAGDLCARLPGLGVQIRYVEEAPVASGRGTPWPVARRGYRRGYRRHRAGLVGGKPERWPCLSSAGQPVSRSAGQPDTGAVSSTAMSTSWRRRRGTQLAVHSRLASAPRCGRNLCCRTSRPRLVSTHKCTKTGIFAVGLALVVGIVGKRRVGAFPPGGALRTGDDAARVSRRTGPSCNSTSGSATRLWWQVRCLGAPPWMRRRRTAHRARLASPGIRLTRQNPWRAISFLPRAETNGPAEPSAPGRRIVRAAVRSESRLGSGPTRRRSDA